MLARYQARLRPALQVIEIAEAQPADGKRAEARALLAALPPRAFAVALDSGGTAPDSLALAALLERWLGLGQPLCFLIGGAAGLDRSVLTRADFTLSLGPPTWPHLLVRALLVEQLYRARCIATGHPYHRAGRP